MGEVQEREEASNRCGGGGQALEVAGRTSSKGVGTGELGVWPFMPLHCFGVGGQIRTTLQ